MRIDLTGKRALVAGVADDGGFGFPIAKALAEAGASVCVGTWPPALKIFETLLRRGKMDESRRMSDGSLLEFEAVFPLDAAWCTMDDVPEEVRTSKRYAERGDFTVQGLADGLVEKFGERPIDIVVHSLANGPDVAKPLMETSRKGYLAALGVSAFSYVSMVKRLAPLMDQSGCFLSLSYLAAERITPHYGGGMSSAKAALESDTRLLSLEAGRRYGVRVNSISAGPFPSRAASVTGAIDDIVGHYEKNSPLPRRLQPAEVANVAAFLCSPLASAMTGTVVHVDNGYHAMGKSVSDDDLQWLMAEES